MVSCDHPPSPDPLALVESLDPDAIAAQIEELDRQQRALRVLLRSARARQRRDNVRHSRGPTHER